MIKETAVLSPTTKEGYDYHLYQIWAVLKDTDLISDFFTFICL